MLVKPNEPIKFHVTNEIKLYTISSCTGKCPHYHKLLVTPQLTGSASSVVVVTELPYFLDYRPLLFSPDKLTAAYTLNAAYLSF